MTLLSKFLVDEDGAVTVDWVVLTGAVVVLAAVVGSALQAPINNELDQIASVVETTN